MENPDKNPEKPEKTDKRDDDEIPMIELKNVRSKGINADLIAIRRDAFSIIVVAGVVIVACFAIWSFSRI